MELSNIYRNACVFGLHNESVSNFTKGAPLYLTFFSTAMILHTLNIKNGAQHHENLKRQYIERQLRSLPVA